MWVSHSEQCSLWTCCVNGTKTGGPLGPNSGREGRAGQNVGLLFRAGLPVDLLR